MPHSPHQTPVAAPLEWQDALCAASEELGRWIRGRLLPIPSPPDGLVPAERFLEIDYLLPVIGDTCGLSLDGSGRPRSRALAGDDPELAMCVAASRFARRYASSLAVIGLVGLAHGAGLDLSPERCAVRVDANGMFQFQVQVTDDEIVRCAERPTEWPVRGPVLATLAELRERVWATLFGRHLAPLFRRVIEAVRVSEALLWTSVGEYVANVSDAAEEYLPEHATAPFVADRVAVLDAPTLPGVDGPNPLRDTVEWVPVERETYPRAVPTRRLCCLTYLVDDRLGTLCQNCPHLPVEQRVEMILERHGVPTGTPSGPAALRSTEIGMQRPSLRRQLRIRGF